MKVSKPRHLRTDGDTTEVNVPLAKISTVTLNELNRVPWLVQRGYRPMTPHQGVDRYSIGGFWSGLGETQQYELGGGCWSKCLEQDLAFVKRYQKAEQRSKRGKK